MKYYARNRKEKERKKENEKEKMRGKQNEETIAITFEVCCHATNEIFSWK